MDTVESLKHLGYILTLHGDNISYQYRGAGVPPIEARGLLNALKERKPEAVEYLRMKGSSDYIQTVLRIFPRARVVSGREVSKWKQ